MKYLAARLTVAAALVAGIALGQSPTNQAPTKNKDAKGARIAKGKQVRHRAVKALNLSDAQKQQMKTLAQQTKLNAAPLRQELMKNRQAMAEAVRNGKSDSEIRQLAVSQGNIRGQMIALRSEARAKFYAGLTPEQKVRSEQMRDRVQQRLNRRLTKGKVG
jgi:Spy/CpxP family protein refolding chaperone